MIRFVDLTEAYWGGDEENMRTHRCCAFPNTVNDHFIRNYDGHVFDGADDLDNIDGENHRDRCKALVPEGFWLT